MQAAECLFDPRFCMPVTEISTVSAVPVRSDFRRIGRARALLTFAALSFASVASLGMVIVRGFYTEHHFKYQFLIWNLLLAWIPAVFAFVTYRFHVRGQRPNLLLVLCLLAWFFFFPNAPYIVTDFVHLEHRPPVPLWFDLLMIASFAWTGLCLGYLSLYLMQEIARARFGRWTSWVFVVVMLALGSVGIYLGRFLRWNSWDVVRNPSALLHQSLQKVEDPSGQLGIVAFVCVSFLFLLTSYCATFALTHLHEAPDGAGIGSGR